MRARKEGAKDEDIIELLGSNLDGPSYENYQCEAKGGSSTSSNGSDITVANSNCYAQVLSLSNYDKYPCLESKVN